MKSPLTLVYALLADVGRANLSDLTTDKDWYRELQRDKKTLASRYKKEGLPFLTRTLPAFFDHVLHCVQWEQWANLTGFACRKGEVIPKLFRGITRLLFVPHTGKMWSRDAMALKSLYQVCYIFKKAEISSDEEILHGRAIDTFWRTDDEITGEIPADIIADLRSLGRFTLRGLDRLYDDWDTYRGRHGPGSVVEGLHSNAKWRGLARSIRAGRSLFPESSLDLLFVEEFGQEDYDPHTLQETTSRLVTVPKNTSSRRTITVEPVENQFFQQRLNKVLRESIERCPILSSCLTLNDQRPNRELARYGSLPCQISPPSSVCVDRPATVDLTSASDLLSCELVKLAFGNHGAFLDAMFRARSTVEGVSLRKYAGMGNATTFPVQSIVFAMLATVTVARLYHRNVKRLGVAGWRKAASLVRVFGDDIIVPQYAFDSFVKVLSECGLKINERKSFYMGLFRESCGLHAFNGIEVTPVMFRIDPRLKCLDDSQIETVCSTSNQLLAEGYVTAARALKTLVPVGKVKPCRGVPGAVGFDIDGPPTVYKHDERLHKRMAQVTVSCAAKRKDALDGIEALLKFFHTPLIERDVLHLSSSVARYRNRLRNKWMPA